ncbi:CubicO group peptidase (beta-lactamase class C family) [Chryseobacterium defluvii]|uniref:CubicO group peptidase (Beta-lactamase class C family) n=1 Tax=Chryseobacterium defluvii TaxID=160396 RepID=A0A840KF85_9FLAO|nr:serine hydrolase domain-containing protein [Chryseobacterium defluvii]MBB4808229.1 CubicO group peptidase (beta-lactamase class C family) [Chryseobacterium defluvii]
MDIRLKIFPAIIFMLLLSVSCWGQSSDEILKSKLDSAFSELFSENEPGGSIFIQQGNKVLYDRSFGLADLKTKEKFTSKTVSNLGSVTKTFVAYGILILQEKRKLSVNDHLLQFFPDFKNKGIASKIKLQHLLTHTSGLPDSRQVEKDSLFYLTAKDEENFRPLLSTDSLEFEPGSKWNYSNPAYNGLALIIEKAGKMKWQHFIRKNIFRPAGMKNSTITDGSSPEKNVAHGYILKDGTYQEYDYGEYPTFTAAGNGGVWSSVEDLKKYIRAIHECKFISCADIQSSKTIHTPENWKDENPMFHSGVWFVHNGFWYNYRTEEQVRVIEHAGDQGGFKSHLIMIPEKDISIIWVTNNNKFITGPIRRILLKMKYID